MIHVQLSAPCLAHRRCDSPVTRRACAFCPPLTDALYSHALPGAWRSGPELDQTALEGAVESANH